MAENNLLYLSQADVVAVGLYMNDLIDAVETGFCAKGEGCTEMPPKISSAHDHCLDGIGILCKDHICRSICCP